MTVPPPARSAVEIAHIRSPLPFLALDHLGSTKRRGSRMALG